MKKQSFLVCGVFLCAILTTSVAEGRAGGGRSFGNRGSRGFSSPSRTYSSPNRHDFSGPRRTYSPPPQPRMNPAPIPLVQQSPSLWKSMGAGIAGGMIGGMISRSLFGGNGANNNQGNWSGAPGSVTDAGARTGGGFGLIEFLLLGGLIYAAYRIFKHFQNKSQENSTYSASSDRAAELMRKTRSENWDKDFVQDSSSGSGAYTESYQDSVDQPISGDQALDVFFKVQAAWANRDCSPIQGILDADARQFLEQELRQLRSANQVNRLENIAVRNTEVVEAWQEDGKEFSTVRIEANVLDYTVDDSSGRVVAGSKTDPVKFEEYWTFSKDANASSSHWKLSAIQQN